MSQMYPHLPKQTSNLYPNLDTSEEDTSLEDSNSTLELNHSNSSTKTEAIKRKHSEINNKEKTRTVTKEKVRESKNEAKQATWSVCTYIIPILTLISILLYQFFYFIFPHQESSQTLPQYFKKIEKLKPNYSPQTDDFWNIIKSFPYFLLSQENPEGPAVLLMVTPAGSLDPALQLSKQLAQTINNFLDSHPKDLHHVNGAILSTESPDVQKRMIDEQIRTMVDNHKQRVVVVVNLEKIDPKAIMIFHGYCDNSEAVYKNIAIILLLELPAGVQAKNNEDVYTHLSQIWGSLGKSRTQALFSRMANNIAILKTN